MIIRLIVKTLLIMFAFPALGLIAFHGGLGGAILAAILVGVATFFTKVVLFPWLATFGLFSIAAGGVIAGGLGAHAVLFAIRTAIFAIALAATAWLVSSVALVGFWPTVGAGAILAVVSSLFASSSKR